MPEDSTTRPCTTASSATSPASWSRSVSSALIALPSPRLLWCCALPDRVGGQCREIDAGGIDASGIGTARSPPDEAGQQPAQYRSGQQVDGGNHRLVLRAGHRDDLAP